MNDKAVTSYRDKVYSFDEAITVLADDAKKRKFDVSVDCAFVLGIDPRKAEQIVRGSVALPHGTGKSKSCSNCSR